MINEIFETRHSNNFIFYIHPRKTIRCSSLRFWYLISFLKLPSVMVELIIFNCISTTKIDSVILPMKFLHALSPSIVMIRHHKINFSFFLGLIIRVGRKMLWHEPLLHEWVANSFWFVVIYDFFFLHLFNTFESWFTEEWSVSVIILNFCLLFVFLILKEELWKLNFKLFDFINFLFTFRADLISNLHSLSNFSYFFFNHLSFHTFLVFLLCLLTDPLHKLLHFTFILLCTHRFW